uniref:Fe2OG dioxygenase domain-containing protein n=1 Tax=Oryza punctata TaxID=4537 RepID=A0A0E0JYH5_ORYPU
MADESWRAPAIVQELAAAGVEEPPSRYLLREKDRCDVDLVAGDLPEPIPVVDLSRLAGGGDEATKLRAALQNWGFFLLTNHGVEASLMDSVMNLSREFFNQPIERKQKFSNLIDGKNFQIQGYGTDRVVTQDQILDWSDRLHLRVEPKEEQDLAFWPDHPESFRDVLNEYASGTKRIRDDIVQAMAKLLELDEDYFLDRLNKAPAFARFNYYPPCSRPDLVFGIRPHSDGTLLTILLVDKDVSGLQIQKGGKWYNVQATPHTLLLNLGDTMEVMCNGIFRSPVHRVVTNAEKERISLAMLYSVNGEKDIEPAAGLLDENRPARYRKVSVGEFRAGIFGKFSRRERYIDSLKI